MQDQIKHIKRFILAGLLLSVVIMDHTMQKPWDPFAAFLLASKTEEKSAPNAPAELSSQENKVVHEILRRTTSLSPEQAVRTAKVICEEANRLGYDPMLFVAIIHIESKFDHLAVSSKGAEGLMQIMPGTARFIVARYETLTRDALDPVNNVRLGIRYVAYLHRNFRKLDNALVAYHRGPETLRVLLAENNGVLAPEVYDVYANKVLQRYQYLKRHYKKQVSL